MKKLVFLLVLFATMLLNGQENKAIQKQIDSALWKPFKKAFETLDAQKLNALYGEQVLRVTPNGMDTKNKFKDENQQRFNRNKATGTNIELDFWFDSRQTNTHTSYEVGFYRMRLIGAKDTNTIYGQFHIVLQKLNGVWKITQDWDTTTINGQEISATDFEKQNPITFE